MTWHLKDRELEEKLIAIGPDFVEKLQKAVKYYKNDSTVFVGFGSGIAGRSRLIIEFRWGELEEIPKYDPSDWNEYPKVMPPEGVLMRVEFILDGILRRNCSTFEKGAWRITKNKYYDPTMNNQDWERWNRRYVDKIKTQEDANVAIDSMIASLNDPYTQYLDREEYKEQTTSIDARIMGIGINIVSVDGNVLIVSVVEGTPAEETGIKAGDIILTVDGKDVRGKTVSDVASLIRGKEGQSVKIELDVKVGDKVRIISGPFADFIGDITEVYPDKSKLRASVSILIN